jgi:hypothetical protein
MMEYSVRIRRIGYSDGKATELCVELFDSSDYEFE